MTVPSLAISLVLLTTQGVPLSNDVENLKSRYGQTRAALSDYEDALWERVNPNAQGPILHIGLTAAAMAGLSSESRDIPKVVWLSTGASALAASAQLATSLGMEPSDTKLGALKFAEFYIWGFQSVAQFFYGRRLIEEALTRPNDATSRRIERRGELHQNLSWLTAIWGFQSTFLRSWKRYSSLKNELARLDATPETNRDYLEAKLKHAEDVGQRFRRLLIDDLQLRGTIEVAVASAALALSALKAPSHKAYAYYGLSGIGLASGMYKLIESWTLPPLDTSSESKSDTLRLSGTVLPMASGLYLALVVDF